MSSHKDMFYKFERWILCNECAFLLFENSVDSQELSGWFAGKVRRIRKRFIWMSVSNFCLLEAIKDKTPGNSLAVQGLGLPAFTAEGAGLMPGQGTKVPQAVWHGQKKKKDKNPQETT